MQMSFATALKEAQQLIARLNDQIRTHAEEMARLQQALVNQCSLTTEREIELGTRSRELDECRKRAEGLESRLAEVSTAREHAEAMVDRQGQRVATLQNKAETQGNVLADQAAQIDRLTEERDRYQARLPSGDDELALADMAALLVGSARQSVG
jgi:chromosome segregation ATPase